MEVGRSWRAGGKRGKGPQGPALSGAPHRRAGGREKFALPLSPLDLQPARPTVLSRSFSALSPLPPRPHKHTQTMPLAAPPPAMRHRTMPPPRALFGGNSNAPRRRPASQAVPSSVSATAAANRGALRLFLDSASVVQVRMREGSCVRGGSVRGRERETQERIAFALFSQPRDPVTLSPLTLLFSGRPAPLLCFSFSGTGTRKPVACTASPPTPPSSSATAARA